MLKTILTHSSTFLLSILFLPFLLLFISLLLFFFFILSIFFSFIISLLLFYFFSFFYYFRLFLLFVYCFFVVFYFLNPPKPPLKPDGPRGRSRLRMATKRVHNEPGIIIILPEIIMITLLLYKN